MNLGRYIKKLLLEHETVIIPGLGAFVSTYNSAQTDEESEKIKPPSKIISFDTKIRNNDGLLMGQIAETEQISLSEALEKIETEREKIRYRLDKDEKVSLGNLGVLFVNENREVTFELSGEDNLLLDAFGLEAISLKDETESISEKLIPADSSQVSEKPAMEEIQEEHEPNPVNQEQEVSPKKKNRGWLWLLLILLPLIAAGIFFLKTGKKDQVLPMVITSEIPETEETAVLPLDSVQTDSTTIPGTDFLITAEEPADTVGYIVPDPSKFYLIGGSFQKMKNAEKYFQKLKNEGYNPFHLGKQGNFYLVGLEIHDNEIEAYGAQYNFLDKHPDSGVWIFISE